MALPSLHFFTAAIEHLQPGALLTVCGGTLILVLAGVTTLTMRRASASARHQIWLLGFLGALALPVLSATLPAWHVLPWPQGKTQFAIITLPESTFPPPRQSLEPEKIPETATNRESITGSIVSPAIVASPAIAKITPVTQTPVTQAPAPSRFRFSSMRELRWPQAITACWLLGSAVVLFRVLLGHLSLLALQRRCTSVTRGEIFDSLECLRGEIGVRRRVALMSCAARSMPMTWGIWRPRLLIPDGAATWSPAHRRDVLLHELGHVSRWDCLTQLLSQVACAFYWFNPFSWIASRRMQVERERACDDLVLNRGAHGPLYARHLLDSVSSFPTFKIAGAAIAMARPSTLEERMKAILNPRQSRRGLTARGTLATALLFVSALIPIASLRAQQAPPDAPSPTRAPAQLNRNADDVPVTTPPQRPTTTRPTLGARGGRAGFGGFGGSLAPILGEGPTCTFDATIYDVRVPADQIGKIDVDLLDKAANSASEFEKALAALGPAKPMYRANESIRLSSDTLSMNSQVPFVTSNTKTANGQTVSNYAYQSLGARFMIAGKAPPAGNPELDLSIQLAAISDTGVTVGNNVTAPVIRSTTLSRKGAFQPHKPIVIVSVDAGSPDKEGRAVAYIARIIMGEPSK